MSDPHEKELREALIADARDGPLDAEAAAELELLADLLADPSTWSTPPAELEDRVVQAVIEAEPAETQALHARRRRWRRSGAVAGVAAAFVAIALIVGALVAGSSSAPDYVAVLHATPLTPGARASVNITRNDAGFHVSLDAQGLAPLKTGEFYQAWLKNSVGVSVPIGTFSSSDGHVTLWSGISPEAFPTMTVTIEKADGDQSSSGRVVLVGSARPHR